MDQQPTELPKVLCIDDTPDVLLLARRLLSADYTVLEAEGSLEGIELAQEAKPDLVLVDLHMPGLSGYEVTTRIKSFLPNVPIVALTADVMPNVRERALASGCDGYLTKPIDPDAFVDQIKSFLEGQREILEDDSHREAYQQELVERLEEKVRQLTRALERNTDLNRENVKLLRRAERQAKLLSAGARVGRHLVSILELDELLDTAAQVVCDEFGFYFVGLYIVDETGQWAELRSGSNRAGKTLVDEKQRFRLSGASTVSVAIEMRIAVNASEIDEGVTCFETPHLPEVKSEVALPLLIGDTIVGALMAQSAEKNAFSEDDIAALQGMADELAMTINNARLLIDLEEAHDELMRTKTFQVIATATGEAIHWVGNKAAPIPGSAARISEDLTRYLIMAGALLEGAAPELREHKFAQLLIEAGKEINRRGDHSKIQTELEGRTLDRLRKMISVESIYEDLEIIESSARSILNIKEDLIGPARQSSLETIALPALLNETINTMGIPSGIVRTLYGDDLSPVRADRVQLNRVFNNLIKNAMEAMAEVADKKLFIWARRADTPGAVVVEITDNGVGIPPEQIDKVWIAFYTTKGDHGGTGLGLAACAQIIAQLDGKITVESDVGLGTTFSVMLPAATNGNDRSKTPAEA